MQSKLNKELGPNEASRQGLACEKCPERGLSAKTHAGSVT